MKHWFLRSVVVPSRVVTGCLLSICVSVGAQTTSTKVVTLKSTTKSSVGASAASTSGTAGNTQFQVQAPASLTSGATKSTKTRVNTQTAEPNTQDQSGASARPLLSRFHPLLNPGGPVINAVQFASAEVNGAGVTMTLTYPAITGGAVATVTAGIDYAVQSSTCTASGCSVAVTFKAKFPGTRSDAVLVKNTDGTLLYETFVTGLGKGPQFRFDLGYYDGYYGFTQTAPYTLAFGPDRKLYVTETNSSDILTRAQDGTISSITVAGLTSPSGIAVDGANNVYVADTASNTILIYSAGGTVSTQSTTPLSNPGQLAVDGSGALYIADTGNGRILKIDNQGVETTLASGLTSPTAVTVDSTGKVYYADQASSDEIFTIASGSTTSVLYQNFINQIPRTLAVDAAGTIYLTTDQGLNRFYPGSQEQSGDTGLDSPFGVAVDVNGGVAFTTPGRNVFTTIDPTSANFILSAPPGNQVMGGFTISNTGNEPLTLSTLSIDQPQWTLDPNSACQNGTILATQARCQTLVDFTPPTATEYDAHLLVSSDSLHTPGTLGTFFLYGSGQGDASHTDLTAAPSAVMVGNPVRLLATVVDDGGNNSPTGTVTFYDGDQAIGTATLAPPSLHVEFDTSSLAVGTHTLTAKYAGDLLVDANTSNAVTVIVSSGAPDPNNGVAVDAHNFGSANVGATGSSFNFSYQQSSQSISASGDFVLGTPSCDATCTVGVTFNPQYPGLRSSTVIIRTGGDITSKTFVYGIGNGPQLGFNSGTDSVHGDLQAPTAIAMSNSSLGFYASPIIVVADTSTNKVYQVTSDGLATLAIGNLATPAALAVGPDGKVYVADSTNNLIFTYDTLTQQEDVVPSSSLSHPMGVAVDGAGNVYILDTGNNRILEVTPQGVESTLVSGAQNLTSIALDSAGNIFYGTATSGSGTIVKIPAGGGQPTEVANGLGPIYAVAVDASGAVYSQNANFTNIFPPPPQNQYLLAYEFPGNMGNRETGLALAPNGDVYATDSDSGQYFVSHRGTGNVYSFVTVGSTGNVSAKVFNDGNAPLTLSAITVSGSTFTVLSSSTCSAGLALPAGGNCDVALKYTPTQAGENHEILTITSNSLNNTGLQSMYDLYGEASNPPQATTSALTFSPSSPTLGQTVTLTATVSAPTSAIIPPGGQVTFMDGSNVLGTTYLGYQTSGSTASANFQVSNLSQGSHSITAVYAGDSNYLTSTSSAVTIVVGAAPLATVSSQNFGSVAVGQSVTQSITFNLSGITDIRLATGSEYTFTQYTCTTSSCTVPVSFAPQVPGLRPDALLVRDTNGVLLAKAYLYGVGTSGQFGFLPGTSSIDQTIQAPVGITFTPNGIGYVTDAATNQVHELISGDPALPISGLSSPAGIAVDGSGVLYIADRGANRIVTFDLQRNTQGVLATSSLSSPGGIATDGLGNIFISDNGNNRIVKISNTGVQTTFASGLNSPQGIATDAAGNVYYADSANLGDIVKIPAAGGTPTVLANTLGTPMGIAVDASGSVYYTGGFSGIRDLIPGVGTVAFSGNTTGSLTGIGINFNGDVWTTQPTTASLEQLHRANTNFYSTTPVGTPRSHTLQVVNTGNTSLTLSNVGFATGTAFTIGSGNTCTNGSVLLPGSVCQTPVQFLPATAQNYSDTLNYTSNTLNVAGSVNHDSETGTGTQPTTVPSTTALTATPTTSVFGGSINFTATVSDTAGTTPTGTVNFNEGSTLLGTGTLTATQLGTATASFSTSTLAVGSHSITAMYNGNGSIAPSTSGAQVVTVNPAPAVISSRNFGNVAVGQSVTMNITYTQGINPTISAVNNLDFVVSTVNCSTGCVATVTFVPQYPGLRDDAVTVKDSNGNLLAKTFVYGTGTAPQFGFDVGSSLTASAGLQQADVITRAPDGTLFIVDANDSTVHAGVGTTFATVPFTGSGTAAVLGLAVDGSKALYIASNNGVLRYDLQTHVTSTVVTDQLSEPRALGVDGAGSLYIADSGNGRVVKVDNQGVETVLARESQAIVGLTLDSAGNVFYLVLSGNNKSIKEIPTAGGAIVTIAQNLDSRVGKIAIDAAGKLYLTGAFTSPSGLYVLVNGQAVAYPIVGISGSTQDVALGPDGSIFVTQFSTGYTKVPRITADNSTTPLSATVGNTVSQHFTVVNTGTSALTISDVRITGGQPYSIDATSACKAGTVVASGATCDGIVDFFPPQPQVYTADVTFISNSLNNVSSVNRYTVTGTGQAVVQVPSTTTLVASPSSAPLGGAITLTATVADTAAVTPGGTVTFVDGTTQVGVANLGAATGSGMAAASISASNLSLGAHSIRALYGGSPTVAPSTSAAQTVTVTQITTATALRVSSANITSGQSETLTATISGAASPALTGSVAFYDGTTQVGTGTITSTSTGGTATLTLSSLTVGTHQFSAIYSGDTNYTQSNDGPVTVTVTQAAAVINAQSFGSALVNGGPVTMTLSYARPAGGITLALVTAVDFSMSQQSCNQTTCSTTVTFSPKLPGSRNDALTVKDLNGTLVAKTFLYGTGTAPQFGFQPGQVSLALQGLTTNPTGVAVGPDGSIYVSDTANRRVYVQLPGGNTGTIAFPTLGTPGGLAVDGSKTVYVADRTNNVILASSAVGVVSTVATSALSSPNFLAVDGTGALYIADTGNNRILKIDNQGVETTVRSLTTAPLGLTVDAALNVYFADASRNGEITMLNAGGFGSTTISGVGATVNALGVDPAGRLYYTVLNAGVSSLFTSRLGAGVTAKYAISNATQAGAGLAVDGGGRVIITEPSIGQVDVYGRAGSTATLTSQAGVQTQTTFTIANTGNTVLTVQSLGVGGTSGTISLDASSTCVAGGTVPVGQTCDVTADFTPAAAQAYQGSIIINTDSLNAGSSTTSYTINGTGTTAAVSTTMLAVSSNNIAIGQPVTLTATVSFASAQPTGTVNFFDGTTMIGAATLGAGSGGIATAQFTTSSLGLGTHSLTAMYGGNGTAPASVSSAQPVGVTQASTTIALVAAPATTVVGRTVTLTATIAGAASPALSGTVTFFDGTNSLGSSLVTATGTGGTAQLAVATLGIGTHSITARYTGDSNYTPSVSAAQTVTVTQVTTTTTLSATPASITLGQTETLTATFGGGTGSPAASGTVSYFDGTTLLGTANVTATSTGGTATLTLLTLSVGTHSITARYSGDTNYAASTSIAQTVTVAQATTSTTLGISAAAISAGQAETLTATVQGLASTLPSGNVAFFDGTTLLGTIAVSTPTQGAASTASLTLSTLAVGTHSITARYTGDTNYTASTSTAQTVTVSSLTSATILAVSAASINAGQSETLTATITGAKSPALGGVVTFFDGTTAIGTGNVTATSTGGTATLTLTTLAAGTRSLTARYSGDANYAASTSGAQTVTVAGTGQTITFPAIPTHTFGDAPFTLNATASSGLAVSYAVVSGPATVSGSTVTLTAAGTVVLQATQAGNATYTAATPVSQSFAVLPPSPTLTSVSPAGAIVGASATTVTLTGTNFSTADTVQVNGTGVTTTFVNATTLTAVIPATSQTAAATLQVAVFDSTSKATTASLPFTISAAPSVTFSGPATTQPAQQPTVALTLTNPYPVALTTTLTLTFAPGSTSLTDDPNVQFSTGGRTETFTIPANSTVTPAILLQSGTVAGRITVTLVLTNPSGVNVTPASVTPVVITIPPTVPSISTTGVTRTGNRITVSVHAFSNTREVTKAIFHFTPAAGYTVDTPDITADVTAAFAAWFSSTASQQYGSSFTYAQDFDLSNDSATVGTVTVTLVNAVGTSTVGTAQ